MFEVKFFTSEGQFLFDVTVQAKNAEDALSEAEYHYDVQCTSSSDMIFKTTIERK